MADPDGTTVVVGGEIDMATAPTVAAQLARALADHPRVTVDLRSVRFLDCSAIRVLVAARHQARARGGEVCVVAAPRWARIIDLTGADLPVVIDADPPEGISRAAAPRAFSNE